MCFGGGFLKGFSYSLLHSSILLPVMSLFLRSPLQYDAATIMFHHKDGVNQMMCIACFNAKHNTCCSALSFTLLTHKTRESFSTCCQSHKLAVYSSVFPPCNEGLIYEDGHQPGPHYWVHPCPWPFFLKMPYLSVWSLPEFLEDTVD